MVFKVTFILLFLVSTKISAQSSKIDFEIKFSYGMHRDPINGIFLNDSGLLAGRFFYEKKIFKTRAVYKTFFIPYEELDYLILYRLTLLLELNSFFYNMEDFTPDSGQFWHPPSIQITHNGRINYILDYYMQSDNEKNGRNYDRYLINELVFLLNDLIPETKNEFRINPPYNMPTAQEILMDKQSK